MKIICDGYSFEFDSNFRTNYIVAITSDNIRITIQFDELKKVVELLEVIKEQDGCV